VSDAVQDGEKDIVVWPAVAEMGPDELQHLAPEWRSLLRQLYPDIDAEIAHWIANGSYDGWRLGISSDGRWLYFLER
jgi:hypothetical protein